MRLRVFDFGLQSAIRSQAVYHGLAQTIAEESDPILSLISPESPYVCIGMHQDIEREVDEDFCRAQGLPIFRRHVGGGAVYLDRDQLFTHFIYPRRKAPEFAINLYPRFIEPVLRTYRELGIEAQMRPVNDIQVKGRKIGGTGAALIGEATVMVGSFMFDFDTQTMSRCLKVPDEKFRDKLYKTLNDYITTMTRELGAPPPRDELIARFLHHCGEALNVTPEFDQPSDAEISAIEKAEATLLDPAWQRRPVRAQQSGAIKISAGTHLGDSAYKAPGGLIRISLLARDGRVVDVDISGDFTCLPPAGLGKITAALAGAPLQKVELERRIEDVFRVGVDMPGISAADLSAAVLAAKPAS